jgi:hypothetical protein
MPAGSSVGAAVAGVVVPPQAAMAKTSTNAITLIRIFFICFISPFTMPE